MKVCCQLKKTQTLNITWVKMTTFLQESMTWVAMNKPIHITKKQRDSLRLLMQVNLRIPSYCKITDHGKYVSRIFL